MRSSRTRKSYTWNVSEPREVRNVILEGRQTLRELMMRNVRAEKPKMDADAVCDLISVFFSGLSIEKNLNLDQSLDHLKVSNFMRMLRSV